MANGLNGTIGLYNRLAYEGLEFCDGDVYVLFVHVNLGGFHLCILPLGQLSYI